MWDPQENILDPCLALSVHTEHPSYIAHIYEFYSMSHSFPSHILFRLLKRWAWFWVAQMRGTKACLTATMSTPKAQYEVPKQYQQLGREKKKENLSLSCCHLWKGVIKTAISWVKASVKITRLSAGLLGSFLCSLVPSAEKRVTCWVRVMDRCLAHTQPLQKDRIVTLHLRGGIYLGWWWHK